MKNKILMTLVFGASIVNAGAAMASDSVSCKLTATQVMSQKGSADSRAEVVLGNPFTLSFPKGDSQVQMDYGQMTVKGSKESASVSVGIGLGLEGVRSIPKQGLFLGVIDFSQTVDKTFAVSGRPVVSENEGTKTQVEAIRLNCTP